MCRRVPANSKISCLRDFASQRGEDEGGEYDEGQLRRHPPVTDQALVAARPEQDPGDQAEHRRAKHWHQRVVHRGRPAVLVMKTRTASASRCG